MFLNNRTLRAGAAVLAGSIVLATAVDADRSIRASRRGTVVKGEEATVAVGRRGAAVATDDGIAAVGRRGAVVAGDDGAAAVGRRGAVVVRVGSIAYTQCGATYYQRVATGYQVVVIR